MIPAWSAGQLLSSRYLPDANVLVEVAGGRRPAQSSIWGAGALWATVASAAAWSVWNRATLMLEEATSRTGNPRIQDRMAGHVMGRQDDSLRVRAAARRRPARFIAIYPGF